MSKIKNKVLNEFKGNNLILLLILVLSSVISISGSLYNNRYILNYLTNIHESPLEYLQAIILIIIILTTILKRKILKNKFGKKIFYMRLLICAFVLFEELSFLTKKFCIDYFPILSNSCEFYKSFNAQGEFNLHNIYFLQDAVITTQPLPLIGDVYYKTIIYSSIFLLISWGSYLPYLKNIKGVFLERRYSINGSIYFIDRLIVIAISLILILFSINNPLNYAIHPEFIEIHFYILVLFDLIEKTKVLKR